MGRRIWSTPVDPVFEIALPIVVVTFPAAGRTAMSVTVNLIGPAPWGFRITGGRDFRKPITVSKVTERGKAALGDLRPGDVIVSINGEKTSEMLNDGVGPSEKLLGKDFWAVETRG
ncbi:hypothetical protein JD844_031126 [Phrynosoma platyrhinos]|uniref:PDZ domain-containing protein n=1 Tax=Phrynosoma platyrhinos TaxID=52577 RepID=A0ABQ7T0Q3_PHRPL|nr:hypothetical protein JD844_031126 [Phrynosoma platyrhinos]